MAKNKRSSAADSVSNFFGGLLGGASKSIKKRKSKNAETAAKVCKSRGLGYDQSTGRCSKN